ncbi:unnamed protein product [Ectocarpus sp. 8 AP-2014]
MGCSRKATGGPSWAPCQAWVEKSTVGWLAFEHAVLKTFDTLNLLQGVSKISVRGAMHVSKCPTPWLTHYRQAREKTKINSSGCAARSSHALETMWKKNQAQAFPSLAQPVTTDGRYLVPHALLLPADCPVLWPAREYLNQSTRGCLCSRCRPTGTAGTRNQ